VKKFRSEPGSLVFRLVREFDVCIRARDLPTAFRKLRERFPQAINLADQSRTSFRFRPSNKACADEPKDDQDNDDGDTPSPFDDPLNDSGDNDSVDDTAIPN
jgi:hypothetical protein